MKAKVLRSRTAISALAVLVFLIAWQIVGSATNPILLATPLAVLQSVPAVWERGLPTAYLETMKIYLISLGIAVTAGFIIGLATGLNRFVRYTVDPLVITLYGTPGIALIPLLIAWFGVGDVAKFCLIFVSSFFAIAINVQLGISEVGAQFLELSRSLGAKRFELLRNFILPGIIPHVLAGFRIAGPRAFVTALAAEMLIDQRSMGGLVMFFGNSFQTDRYFVPVLVITLTSVLLAEGANKLEHGMTRWRQA